MGQRHQQNDRGIGAPASIVRRLFHPFHFALLILAAFGAGCAGETNTNGNPPPGPPSPPPPPPVNNAPSISGSPTLDVVQGTPYSFTPTASDPDGDSLSFSISGQPPWTMFDGSTGTLDGTPGQVDVRIHPDIVISVSDGQASSSLAPFAINVTASAAGTVTLNWTAPMTNADGTMLNDLAGYIAYWGTVPDVYTQSEPIDNAGVTSYVLSNLAPGTYHFVIVAVDLADNESAYSNPFTATVP